MVQIKIIRHSERLDFTHPFYWLVCFGHYWADSPLTTNGHKIANSKGKIMVSDNFDPKHIYTSPYTRTMATTTEIKASFPYSEIVIEPLLSEYQPNFKHRINLYPNGIPTTYDGQETEFIYPETYEDFSKRVQFIVSKLIEKHDQDFIIVTHGEVLKVYINYIQSLYPDLILDPGSTPYLTTLTFEYDKINKQINENSVKID
jgi:broad specificity phosphatase PhoE